LKSGRELVQLVKDVNHGRGAFYARDSIDVDESAVKRDRIIAVVNERLVGFQEVSPEYHVVFVDGIGDDKFMVAGPSLRWAFVMQQQHFALPVTP